MANSPIDTCRALGLPSPAWLPTPGQSAEASASKSPDRAAKVSSEAGLGLTDGAVSNFHFAARVSVNVLCRSAHGHRRAQVRRQGVTAPEVVGSPSAWRSSSAATATATALTRRRPTCRPRPPAKRVSAESVDLAALDPVAGPNARQGFGTSPAVSATTIYRQRSAALSRRGHPAPSLTTASTCQPCPRPPASTFSLGDSAPEGRSSSTVPTASRRTSSPSGPAFAALEDARRSILGRVPALAELAGRRNRTAPLTPALASTASRTSSSASRRTVRSPGAAAPDQTPDPPGLGPDRPTEIPDAVDVRVHPHRRDGGSAQVRRSHGV